MENTVLFAAAEALISRELGVDAVARSGCDLCFLYKGSYVEVKPSEYIDEQEPPYFNIRRVGSTRPSDVCIFSVRKGEDWDFYIVKTSAIDSCFDSQSCVGLPLIKPISIHTKIDGIKKAVDLTCSV